MREKLKTVGKYSGSVLATLSTGVGAISFKSGKALLVLEDVSNRLKFYGPGRDAVMVVLSSGVLYCVIFTRIPSFWEKFKPKNDGYTEIESENIVVRSKVRAGFNILGYSVGVARAPFNFLNTFIGAYSILNLISSENIVILSSTIGVYAAISNQFAYFIYTFGSIRKNCLRMAKKIEEKDSQSLARPQGIAEKIFKMIAKRFLDSGTLSFGAMSFFLTREALLVIPVSRDFSPLAIKLISGGSALTAVASEILSKNLDLHNLIDDGVGNFIRQTKETKSLFLYPHLAMGLIFTFGMGVSYFDGCLNVSDDLGLSALPFFLDNIWLFFTIFTIFACSGGMLEFAFTVKPMFEGIANPEVHPVDHSAGSYQHGVESLQNYGSLDRISLDEEKDRLDLLGQNTKPASRQCSPCCLFSRRKDHLVDASSLTHQPGHGVN